MTVQVELESYPLSWITNTKAVLDSCSYNSLLILTVMERNKRLDQVYMFQCEEIEVTEGTPVLTIRLDFKDIPLIQLLSL